MFGLKKKPKPVHVYSYVGEHVWTAVDEDETAAETRKQIATTEDIAGWVKDHHDEAEFNGLVPASFIIDCKYNLWIASRYSEHVACACGNDVLTAGEIFFGEEDGGLSVDRITNQSTGYCPEPSSWDIVNFVLKGIELPHPEEFDPAFIFRWCKPCGNIEIVKDDDFTCLMCGADLPEEWNVDQWKPLEDEEEDQSVETTN